MSVVAAALALLVWRRGFSCGGRHSTAPTTPTPIKPSDDEHPVDSVGKRIMEPPAGDFSPGSLHVKQRNVSSSKSAHMGGMTSATWSTDLLKLPSTMAAGAEDEWLLTALDNLACAEPPEPFAGQFILGHERTHGGQAVVVFAHDIGAGFMHYAIKCTPHRPCRLLCSSLTHPMLCLHEPAI
jgi:hypothetical protein